MRARRPFPSPEGCWLGRPVPPGAGISTPTRSPGARVIPGSGRLRRRPRSTDTGVLADGVVTLDLTPSGRGLLVRAAGDDYGVIAPGLVPV